MEYKVLPLFISMWIIKNINKAATFGTANMTQLFTL
jgi:hypothetical protein